MRNKGTGAAGVNTAVDLLLMSKMELTPKYSRRALYAKSSLGQIWSIKNSQVRVIDNQKGQVLQEWNDKLTIIDEFVNQVTLMDERSAQEIVISLSNLKVQTISN